ncbi:zinc finger protein 1035 isoform X2 [Denticeps clupeoides]|nr:uncharacterized protein LOC114789947 isoform X2 [Denticeps clupeoides]
MLLEEQYSNISSLDEEDEKGEDESTLSCKRFLMTDSENVNTLTYNNSNPEDENKGEEELREDLATPASENVLMTDSNIIDSKNLEYLKDNINPKEEKGNEEEEGLRGDLATSGSENVLLNVIDSEKFSPPVVDDKVSPVAKPTSSKPKISYAGSGNKMSHCKVLGSDACNQEVERSCFGFLESCLKSTEEGLNTNLDQGIMKHTDGQRSDCEDPGKNMNESCVTRTKPPGLTKAVLGTTDGDPAQKELVDDGIPPVLRARFSKPFQFSQVQNQDPSLLSTKDTCSIIDNPLITSQIQKKKMQPVVVLQRSLGQSVDQTNIYHCAACQITTQSSDQLIEHYHRAHVQHQFLTHCTCGGFFTDQKFAEQHLCELTEQNQASLSPKKIGPYKCRYCPLRFSKKRANLLHEGRHKQKTPYQCTYCGLYFSQSCSMRRHQRMSQCLFMVKSPVLKEQQTTKKFSVKPFEGSRNNLSPKFPECFVKLVDLCKKDETTTLIRCTICNKSFKLRAQYNSHIRTHTGDETNDADLNATSARFKCPVCPRLFKYSYNCLRHLRQQCLKQYTTSHKSKVGSRYKCPLCSATFSLSANRSRHLSKTCLPHFKLKQISKTDDSNRAQDATKETSQRFQKDMKYKCKLCPAGFAWSSGLYRHMQRHRFFEKSGRHFTAKKGMDSKPLEESLQVDQKQREESTGEESDEESTLPCRFCGKTFQQHGALKKHMALHRGDRPYCCLECGKRFSKLAYLSAHKKCHQRRIQCTVCRKIVPTISELIQHRQSHINKGMLKCPDCPMEFRYPVFLLRHVASHERKQKLVAQKEMPPNVEDPVPQNMAASNDFMCSVCKKGFEDATALSEHCLSHVPKFSSKCSLCRRQFCSRAALIRHVRIHTGEKPFTCPGCGMPFHRKERLKVHMELCKVTKPVAAQAKPVTDIKKTDKPTKSHVIHEVKKNYKCSHCPQAFVWSSSLAKHMKGHISKTIFPCSKCGKCYKMMRLTGHERTCDGKDTSTIVVHSCAKCDKTFSRKDNKNNHEKNCCGATAATSLVQNKNLLKPVKDRLPHRCPHCSKSFRYRSYLLKHLPVHTRDKQYTCMHCGHKYASQRRYLHHEAFCDGLFRQKQAALINEEAHSQSNTNLVIRSETDGQFKCKFCTKSFSKTRNLRRHILTHTDVKPYRCKTCDSCFSRYDHLKLHQNRCRGKRRRLEVRINKISPDCVGTGWQNNLEGKEQLFECKHCSKCFTSTQNLSRHTTLLHTSDKPFRCKHCGTLFSHKSSLSKHTLLMKCKHTLQNSSLAKAAEAEDPSIPRGETSKLLQRIQGQYSNKMKYQCAYCPRRFKDNGQLLVHTRLHTGEKPYGCANCGERFIRRDYLQRHLTKCVSKGENVLCDHCGESFAADDFGSHQMNCKVAISKQPDVPNHKTSNPSKIREFSCTHCSDRFLLFSQLQQHFLSKHRDDQISNQSMVSTQLQQQTSQTIQIKEEPMNDIYDDQNNTTQNITVAETKKSYICPHCNTSFMNNGALSMHIRTHTQIYPFTCKKCNKGFWSKYSLRKHLRKCQEPGVTLQKEKGEGTAVTPDQEFPEKVLLFNEDSSTGTGVLQTKFSCKDLHNSSSIDLAEHGTDSEKGTVINKYQCSECDQSFTDGLRLISHLEDHGREAQEKNLCKCKQCGKVFPHVNGLTRHLRTQHGKKHANICSVCFRSFRYPSDLDMHKVCHDPNRPFACSICGCRFWRQQSLAMHFTHVHRRHETQPSFTCVPCNRSYTSRASYRKHNWLKHSGPKKKSDCEVAGDSSSREYTAQVNVVGEHDTSAESTTSDDDSDSAPYFPCHVCGKTFPTSESLEDHQRCHLGEKPFECEECGKCFVQLVNLQQHQRTHKSEFQCQTCGRGFVTSFALRTHKHTHTKNRPHRCSKCQLAFPRHSQLAEHIKTHRDDNFPCDLCNQTFSCKVSREEHRRVHSGPDEDLPPLLPTFTESFSSPGLTDSTSPNKYRCGICNHRYKDPEQLSEHGCKAAKERPYSCPDCNKHFLHGSHLKKHQLSHQASGPHHFQCTQCLMSFSYRHHFLNHIRKHEKDSEHAVKNEGRSSDRRPNSELLYRCPICPASFAQAMELANHLSLHSYMCNICNLTFASKEQLVDHEQCHLTAAAQYECTECGDSFLGSEAFRRHHCAHRKRLHVNNGPSQPSHRSVRKSPGPSENEDEEVDVGEDFYKCSVCKKRFSSKGDLQEHVKWHAEFRPFKCKVCGKGFTQKRYLTRHQQIHERLHRCDKCPQLFVNESSLLAHQASHTQNWQFQCSVCTKAYNTAEELSQHEKKHATVQNRLDGSGEHRCDMCYKSFSQLSQLRKHQESHVGQVVYECTECDKAFAFFHLLEEHQCSHAAASSSSAALSKGITTSK